MNKQDFHPRNIAEVSTVDSTNGIESEQRKPRKIARFRFAAVAVGLLIFTVVVYEAGYKTVIDAVSNVGWVFLLVVTINVSRHLLRAFGIRLLVPRDAADFSYKDAVIARFGGEAAGIISFTGAMVSEATKAALLRHRLSLERSISTMVLDNMIYALSVIMMVFGAAVLLITSIGTGERRLIYVVIGIAVLMFFGFVGMTLSLKYRFQPITYILKKHGEKRWVPHFLSRRRDGVYNVENAVFSYYATNRREFLAVLGVNFAAHLLSVVEVYSILKRFGMPSGMPTAFIIESLTKVINVTFSMIPGNLGVYEGGASVIFRVLGFAAATGVALAIVRRGAILFSTAIGLLLVLWQNIEKKRSVANSVSK